MNYAIESDNEGGFIASTEDYPGTFFGYGDTEADALEDLKREVEFALTGGYRKEQDDE